jgi:hypothetical protein
MRYVMRLCIGLMLAGALAGCVPDVGAPALETPAAAVVQTAAPVVSTAVPAILTAVPISPLATIAAEIPTLATPAAPATPAAIIAQTSVPSTVTAGISVTAAAMTPFVSTPVGPSVPVSGTSVTPSPNGVTLADNGVTITVGVGQRFLLNLGEGYDWTVTIADQSVLSRVIGVLTIRGSQGLYEAHKPGQTVLSAAGEPTCRAENPPCGMPSRLFSLNVAVR